MKKTMIAAAGKSDDNCVRCTFTFDLSKKEDLITIAKLRRLAQTPGSGVTMVGENAFYFHK